MKTVKSQGLFFISAAVITLIWSACTPKTPESTPINYASLSDADFDQLFTRFEGGFTGGDGTYSQLLPDGRTVWIFGDTFIGPVAQDLTREKTDPKFIRNSFVVQDGDQMVTIHQGEPEEFKSMMIPPEVLQGKNTELEIWYWPGDAAVVGDTLAVFASKFTQTDTGMWDFKFIETAVLYYSLPDLQEIGHFTIPETLDLPIHFGHAVYQNDDFVYIYGLGKGGPCVARAGANSLHENWEFYADGNWHSDISKAQPMMKIDGSEQFSVIQLKDRIALITQMGSFSTSVNAYVSDTPTGPWSGGQLIYDTPIPFDNDNLITYNTVAHPQFNEQGQLLISYNTNSFILQDHYTNAAIYKPRFARVAIDSILNRP